jgi:peptide-methionine (S)-S-oxide reductase
MEKATFAAGCFWGVESDFRRVPGVSSVTVGYSGGTMKYPGYGDVSTGRTGHAESVEITYDPAKVTYNDLLEVFWSIHDPTTMDRQGADRGSQYRSAIFYHSEAQQTGAEDSKKKLERSGRFKREIVTEISPATSFYPAEEYHQRYFEKQGGGSCHS